MRGAQRPLFAIATRALNPQSDGVRTATFTFVLALAATSAGCGSRLASPFDAMKGAPATALRLQNYEPQAATPGAAQTGAMTLPPVLQQWATIGAQMLPPGLLPPNLLPGAQPTAAPASVPRFHNFAVLQSAPVLDDKSRDELLDIFGQASNFRPATANCMYAEFGVSIAQRNGPPVEILVSLSCGQVQAFNVPWPHANTGLPPETAKRIVAVMQKSFGG